MVKHLLIYLYLKIKYKNKCKFTYSSHIDRYSIFEGANRIYPDSIFSGTLGYGSYIGRKCEITAKIGRFTSIAPYVTTNHGMHPFAEPFVSTSPMFYSTKKQNGNTYCTDQLFAEYKHIVEIGNDCWIGQHSFISGGVKINDGAVVLAGSVVTADVPPYSIVGGVPARVIKYRYDQDTIDFLLKVRWWEKDEEWFRNNYLLLSNIDKFKSYFTK